MKYYNIFILVFITTLFSCTSSKKVSDNTSNIIVQSEELSNSISYVQIPIEVDLTKYLEQAEKSIQKEFTGASNECEGLSYNFNFNRDPLKIKGSENKFQLDISGKYSINTSYCPKCTDFFGGKSDCIIPRINASCGVNEPKRRVTIDFITDFSVLPDYKLKSNTKINEIESLDKCEFTFMKYDVTKKIFEVAKTPLNNVAKTIDKEISKVQVKKYVEQAWQKMTEPILLDGYGYLYINPQALSVSKLSIVNDKLYGKVNVDVQPNVYLEQNTSYKPMRLPNLSTFENKNGFQLNVNFIANYDSLSNLINRQMLGKTIQLKDNEIVIDQVKITQSLSGKLLLNMSFSGDKKGAFYLEAIPKIDSEKKEIFLTDINFDLKSKNAVLKSAKWFLSKKVIQEIEKSARFKYEKLLKEVEKNIDAKLNFKTDQLISTGNVKSSDLISIKSEKEFLQLKIVIQGQNKLLVK